MDEADTYLEQNDEFRGILNSGHTPDTANVWRCVGQDHDPKSFTTWAPMAIAKIGTLPDTLATRSIIISMRRKRFDETVEKFDAVHHGPFVEELGRKVVRWAQDNLQSLSDIRPGTTERVKQSRRR
jgi:putative DNA primase/helicase